MTGTCDCCGQEDTALNFRIAYGIETYACNKCCGIEDEDTPILIVIGELPVLVYPAKFPGFTVEQIRDAVKPPNRCVECGANWADPPSEVCPGCEAYREHTR